MCLIAVDLLSEAAHLLLNFYYYRLRRRISLRSPWLSGTKLIVAVNAPQFFGSQTCGLCLAYKGLGPGAGGKVFKP